MLADTPDGTIPKWVRSISHDHLKQRPQNMLGNWTNLPSIIYSKQANQISDSQSWFIYSCKERHLTCIRAPWWIPNLRSVWLISEGKQKYISKIYFSLLLNAILSSSFYGKMPSTYETTATASLRSNSRYSQARSRFIFIILLHLRLPGQLTERSPIS